MYFNFANLQDNELEVIPLFPSVCGQVRLKNKYDYILEDVKKNIEFQKVDNKFGKNNYISKSRQILKSYTNLQKDIESVWNCFKSDILGSSQIDFKIVSSWITKFDSDSFCHLHGHCNSYYSGVFYLTDYEQQFGGELFLNSDGVISDQIVVENQNLNVFNAKEIRFAPIKNTVIFFPSYLKHKVEYYTGKNSRYSIAFNILPKMIYQEGYDAPVTID